MYSRTMAIEVRPCQLGFVLLSIQHELEFAASVLFLQIRLRHWALSNVE